MMSTTRADRKKPKKPYPDFPLFPHANGLWAKKIKGRLYYFGRWDDPDAALKKYTEQRDDLFAGRKPREKDDGLRLGDLANRFLTTKRRLLENGELAEISFSEYYRTCEKMVRFFGRERRVDDLATDDFEQYRAELAKTRGPTSLGSEITRTRSVLKYAFDQGLIAATVRYGQSFAKPSKQVLLKHRNARGPKLIEADDLRKLLDAAWGAMKSMILLGINCGFGPTDLTRIRFSHINLKTGWADYPRPKTGVRRRCPLWPETVKEIEAWLKIRPTPHDKADEQLVFITRFGQSWAGGGTGYSVTLEFRKMLIELKLHRPGLGFYALRHGFETIGGDSRDQVAVDHVMGHSRGDMASVYRERISDERLVAVTDHVRNWLFPKAKQAK